MKKLNIYVLAAILVLAVSAITIGCASGPKLGTATPLQQALNKLPEITIAGKDLKFEFGGDTWIARVDGKDFSAGNYKSEDNEEGSTLTLKQTHLYSTEQKPGIGGDIGWVQTPGVDIVLEYKIGPPETLGVK